MNASDAARLGIKTPTSKRLHDEVLAEAGGHDSAVRITLTRGSAPRGYRIPPGTRARRIISAHAYRSSRNQSARGIRVRRCETRLALQPLLAGMKHLNRLEQVLARAEWRDKDITEGLMYDAAGHVIGGTMTNLFFARDGRWHTPAITNCGIAGVMRQWLIERLQALGTPAVVGEFTDADLAKCTELFVCNSVHGIWPIVDLAGRRLAVGPLTRALQGELPEVLRP